MEAQVPQVGALTRTGSASKKTIHEEQDDDDRAILMEYNRGQRYQSPRFCQECEQRCLFLELWRESQSWDHTTRTH